MPRDADRAVRFPARSASKRPISRSGEAAGRGYAARRGQGCPLSGPQRLKTANLQELRNRAPLIPVVTVGNAEIFPILGRTDWRWFSRFTEWPFLPIAPTFPLLSLPLPSAARLSPWRGNIWE